MRFFALVPCHFEEPDFFLPVLFAASPVKFVITLNHRFRQSSDTTEMDGVQNLTLMGV